MNHGSRQSFFRAEKATIIGHDDSWFILLSKSVLRVPYNVFNKYQDESWWVESGNIAVSYSSAYAAIQALQRVRRDLPWTIFESKPQPKPVATELATNETLEKHAAQNIRAEATAKTFNAQKTTNPSVQIKSEKKVYSNTLVKDEANNDRLSEMARAAWALSELGHTPSTPEELNQVLKRLKDLRERKA